MAPLIATVRKSVLTGLEAAILILLVFPCVSAITQAQSAINFTPADRFSIPEYNGTISFAVNGSCSSAILENHTWTFRDLTLRSSQPLGNLTVSVENSNMTIYSYRGTSNSAGGNLRCNVQGQGRQTVNLGLNTTQPTHASEWYVTVPGADGNTVFLAENEGWILLPDNSVVVTGVTGNLSITHYGGFAVPDNSNLPFYEQHSIIIITTALVAVTVAVAVAIKFKARS